MHPSSIVPPPMFFKLAYASDGFYVRLVEAVVSFILDYEQLLIIFICASKFFLVLILTAPLCRLSLSLLFLLLYLRHISWPTAANACPSGLLFLLFSCYTLCCSAIVVLRVLFVRLSVCQFVGLSICSPSRFQHILLAALSLSPSAFHLLCRLLLLLLLPTCFCCCCLSRIST